MTHKQRIKLLFRIAFLISLAFLTIFVTILLVRAFDSRRGPDLHIWHQVELTSEFNRKQHGDELTFEQYQQIEDELFAELDKKVVFKTESSGHEKFNRYTRSSPSSPDRFTQNWNRSFELVPDQIEGGILLIHGLTDSPYSMKKLAELFYANNIYVLALRMPSHGTAPAALTDISWKDWMAAVKMGTRHVKQKAGKENPFYIAGYSNGGALSLFYTLESLDNTNLARPDGVFLFSPAIGISKFAVMAQWMKLTAVIPYFEKSKWTSIAPEYDPFKYNSFPLNAAEQSRNLSKQIQKIILDHQKKVTISKLPPVITFQSVVDSTVIAPDVLSFYEKLSPNRHEFVVFDVNRSALLQNFMKTHPLKVFNEPNKSGYKLTIITNKNSDSKEVVARIKDENSSVFNDVSINMSWPEDIYSLSHLAIPFTMDDPVYGTNPPESDQGYVQLGNIYLKGERNVLRIKEEDLMRLRCNPFWDYIESRINRMISEDDFRK